MDGQTDKPFALVAWDDEDAEDDFNKYIDDSLDVIINNAKLLKIREDKKNDRLKDNSVSDDNSQNSISNGDSYQRQDLVDPEVEEPLILVNFTKFTDGHVCWNTLENKLSGERLFEVLNKKINETKESFTRVTEDLWQRGLAFHSTTKTWREDIRAMEKMSNGDFFSMLTYPLVVGDFLVSEMWRKIKERTEWKSVDIIKCVYLAKCNKPITYKHQMALALEFMAMEQEILGSTAKLLLQEEDQEAEDEMERYKRALYKKHEKEITKSIIDKLQQSINQSEGIDLNDKRIFDNNQQPQQQQEGEDDEYDYEEEDEYYEDDENDNNNVNSKEDIGHDGEDNFDEQEDSYSEEYIDEADNEDEDVKKKDKVENGGKDGEDDNGEEDGEYEDEDEEFNEEDQERRDNEDIEKMNQNTDLIPPRPRMNILDQVMAMVFSSLTVTSDKESHYKSLSRIQQSVKDTWIEEFGCLPPTCIWREDMSP